EQVPFNGDGVSNRYKNSSIALNDNDNIWIVAQHGTVGYRTEARRSTNLGDGDISAWNATDVIGGITNGARSGVVVSKTGDTMYLLTSGEGKQIFGYLYDGTSWVDQ